jgi:signal transduction histidine kinase/NO-binding membrane sensor protein with MHYT domain
MYRIYACVTQEHDLRLVALAAILCLCAAFSALSLAGRARDYAGFSRVAWLSAGAVISGTGIWATHFVAMLAFDTGLPTGFDVGLTVLSLLIAIVVTGLGMSLPVYVEGRFTALGGGAVFGVGISSMHFIGMEGLVVPALMQWDGQLVLAAWLLGCGLAAAAINLAHADLSMPTRIKGALILTLAICAMHFTGMAALELTPSPLAPMPEAFRTGERLAFDIGIAALTIMTVSAGGALVDQHLAGRRAREAERLHGLVNATFEGIGICAGGKLVEANNVLADLLQVPADELLERPFADFISPERREDFLREMSDADEAGLELPLLPVSGSPIFVQLLIKTIEHDKSSARVVAVRDITERRAAQRKLEEYRDHLEQQVAERTAELTDQAERLAEALDKERELAGLQRQFVSMVSHEFRTPLAIIDGHAQRIVRRSAGSLPDRSLQALGKIRMSVTRLTELMESVLAAARMEDGRITFQPDECSLHEMLGELARNYGELSPHHQILLDVDQAPERITADSKLLRQVFSNLISNAVKYSPDGGRVWVNGKTGNDGDVVIEVRDEGVGIPSADQEKLFARFFRAGTSTGIAGTGIGLHLALHLVQMHGGTIDVESVEGQGTTFCVRLPIRPIPTEGDAGTIDMPRAQSVDQPEAQIGAA